MSAQDASSPRALRVKTTDVHRTNVPGDQCIAFLRSDPNRRCSRTSTDVSGYCGTHLGGRPRSLYKTCVEDCAICLASMKYKMRTKSCITDVVPPDEPVQGRGVLQTTCRHVFHTNCLKRWMVHHQTLTCPMCRSSIMVDLRRFDIPHHKRLRIIYQHFPPPVLDYGFPSHLSRMLMMPSVIRALGMNEEQRAILIDIAFNCMFSTIFFRVLRLNEDILGP